MKRHIILKPRAVKQLKRIPLADREKIIEKIELLEDSLQGDIKKLVNQHGAYRLRIGQWRVLFHLSDIEVFVYRIAHRKEAYL